MIPPRVQLTTKELRCKVRETEFIDTITEKSHQAMLTKGIWIRFLSTWASNYLFDLTAYASEKMGPESSRVELAPLRSLRSKLSVYRVDFVLRPETQTKAVPDIDGSDCKGQFGDLFVAKMRSECLKVAVWRSIG